MAVEKISLELETQGNSKQVRPLDTVKVEVHVTGLSQRQRGVVTVTDAHGEKYASDKLVLEGGKGKFEFMTGGALGRHKVEVTVGTRKTVQTFELVAVTEIVTNNDEYNYFFEKEADVLKQPIKLKLDGVDVEYVGGTWLRDHVHILKASKYWAGNVRAMVDYYLKNQCKDGSFSDFFYQSVDGTPSTLWRMDAEADLEYIMVEAVHRVWQVTGNDRWMFSKLKKLEKGLNYNFTDPHRWSSEHGLIKRPFTIDTWDFEYVATGQDKGRAGCPWNWKTDAEIQRHVSIGTAKRIDDKRYILRAIDDRSRFCIMHGDNSGLFRACELLSQMNAYKSDKSRSRNWNKKADEIRRRTNDVCWNGKFYKHQVHLDPVTIPGDEKRQLSLSNTYDMNRGLPSHGQAVSIIKEYQKRRKSSGSFAEWFSIDPPYPDGIFKDGGNNEAGVYVEGAYGNENEYINGTVMPLVAGELAKASFDHGFETYGADIILRVARLLKKHGGREFFMYKRDGNPWFLHGKTDQGGPSPWGTAAMVYAYVEGLAGVEDRSTLYQRVAVSPRWVAGEATEAFVITKYGPNQAYFAYRYKLDPKQKTITLQSTGSGDKVDFHVLLPKGKVARAVNANGKKITFKNSKVEKSNYVDFSLPVSVHAINITW